MPGILDEVRSLLHPPAEQAERAFDLMKARVGGWLRLEQPVSVVPYNGMGTDRMLYVHGRVLENQPMHGPKDDATWWENMADMFRRWESDEVRGEPVLGRFSHPTTGFTREVRAESDEEGYFTLTIPLDRPLPGRDTGGRWGSSCPRGGMTGGRSSGRPRV